MGGRSRSPATRSGSSRPDGESSISASARSRLGAGWSADVTDERRTATAAHGTASLALDLIPEPGPYLVEMVARADGGGIARVSLNGVLVGRVTLTGAWRGHRVTVDPAVLRLGRNVLDIFLEERTLIDTVRLAPAPGRVLIDVGTPEARSHLGAGWSVDERDGDRTLAWSDGPNSMITALMSPERLPYELVLDATALAAPGPPLDASVTINGRPAGRLAIPSDERAPAVLPIAEGLLITGENHLELGWSRVVRPNAEDPRSTDARDLAAHVDRIRIVPQRASGEVLPR
jgi:hypothetical protein